MIDIQTHVIVLNSTCTFDRFENDEFRVQGLEPKVTLVNKNKLYYC